MDEPRGITMAKNFMMKGMLFHWEDTGYKLLGVRNIASPREINKSFRTLSAKLTTDSRAFESWLNLHQLPITSQDSPEPSLGSSKTGSHMYLGTRPRDIF
jgi:hypothetical protein